MVSANSNDKAFGRKLLTVFSIILLSIIGLFLLYRLTDMMLVIFAGILLAVFFSGLTQIVQKYTKLPYPYSLALVIILLIGLTVFLTWFIVPRVTDQADRLMRSIPNATDTIKSFLEKYKISERVFGSPANPQQFLPNLLDRVSNLFTVTMGAVIDAFIILFLGIYLAINPQMYIRNFIKLFHPKRRERLHEVFKTLGIALQWWLLGRFTLMIVLGILTYIGLTLIGIPMALTLALIVALLSFVPYIGAIVSVIPAILVALADHPIKALYVLIVYAIVQLLESYIITPYIQHKAVSLPPALIILAQIIFGVLAGVLGAFLATPLMVVLVIIIQLLYIEDILGDKVQLLGQH